MSLVQDFRFGLRRLRRSWKLAGVILLIGGLGTGPNTVVFSLLRGTLWRDLPYPNGRRLAVIWNVTARSPRSLVAPLQVSEWNDHPEIIGQVAAIKLLPRMVLKGGSDTEQVQAAAVTPAFFELLGVRAAVGRTLSKSDRGFDAVVLSDDLWRRHFRSDQSVIGSQVRLGERAHVVLGVMPKGFDFPRPLFPRRDAFDVWVPLVFKPQEVGDPSLSLTVLSLLHPDLQPDNFSRRLSLLVPPEVRATVTGVNVVKLHEAVTEGVRPALLLVSAAMGFVLLLTSANLANLFLSQLEGRRADVAIRLALGATKRRIIWEFILEMLFVAFGAALLGVLLAYWTIPLISSALPAEFPRFSEIGIDWFVLTTAFLVSIVAFALAAALPIAGSALSLKEEIASSLRAGSFAKRRNVRGGLVVAEIAIAMILTAAAFITARAYFRLTSKPLGYEPDHVLTVPVSLPAQRYGTDDRVAEFARLLGSGMLGDTRDEVSAIATGLPGIYAGASTVLAQAGTSDRSAGSAKLDAVSGEYFEAMGIPLLSGRTFGVHDGLTSKPVAILDGVAARTLGLESAVGRQIVLENPNRTVEVVGVVGETHLVGDGARAAHMYVPFAQSPIRSFMLVIRTQRPIADAVGTAKRVIRSIDSDLAVGVASPLRQRIDAQTGGPRFHLVALGTMGLLALLLAGFGVFSVMEYMLSLRMREIAIRSSLGASRSDLTILLAGNGVRWLVEGTALGLLGNYLLSKSVSAALPEIQANDLVGISVAMIVVGLGGMCAIMIPALRVIYSVDTMSLLRDS